ncbi:tetratricopeptide repeat protein [Methylocella sp.]|uniref:tetratricopeptide repeat protein n=1 Tax=Methylocella sp. TaxID=1978226 RepID=UPI0035B2C23F
MSFQDVLAWLSEEKNQKLLAWLGGGAVAVFGAVWTVYVFRVGRKDKKLEREDKAKELEQKKSPAPSIMMTVNGNAQASGPSATYNAPVNIHNNPDPSAIVAPIRDDIGQLRAETRESSAQLKELAAQIAREKGVPLASLRAILEKIGETEISEEAIPRLLEAKADELLKLREEIEAFRAAFPDLAAIVVEAEKLIEAGALDKAHDILVKGREAARARRQDAARAEARLLSLDAGIDDLKLAYRSAAEKYGEAASLVAGFDAGARFDFLSAQQHELYKQGLEFGDNPSLIEAVTVARQLLAVALNGDQRGATQNNLGNALATLGARESGTARLEQAVDAYRETLKEYTRDRVPLDWAMTQNNLGNALQTLGELERGTTRLEDAVEAYRAALQEYTRDRVPLQWATTQNNLGVALRTLGARESGTARLEQAVEAYREALKERARDRVPLDWATTQNNLGAALRTLGERESGTTRLEDAVEAYRAALQEYTRERVPLDWAMSYGNQGVSLMLVAERTGDKALAKTALNQIVAAEKAMRDGGHIPFADYYAAKLPKARTLADSLQLQ